MPKVKRRKNSAGLDGPIYILVPDHKDVAAATLDEDGMFWWIFEESIDVL